MSGSSSENTSPCTASPVPNQDGLQQVQKNFDGIMAVMLTPHFAEGAAEAQPVGVLLTVTRGVISGVIGYFGDPSPDQVSKLGKQAFGASAQVAAAGGIVLAGLEAPLVAAMVLAGAVAYFISEIGGGVYDWIMDNLERLTEIGKYDPKVAHIQKMECSRQFCANHGSRTGYEVDT